MLTSLKMFKMNQRFVIKHFWWYVDSWIGNIGRFFRLNLIHWFSSALFIILTFIKKIIALIVALMKRRSEKNGHLVIAIKVRTGAVRSSRATWSCLCPTNWFSYRVVIVHSPAWCPDIAWTSCRRARSKWHRLWCRTWNTPSRSSHASSRWSKEAGAPRFRWWRNGYPHGSLHTRK